MESTLVQIAEAAPVKRYSIPCPPDNPYWKDTAAGDVGDYRPLIERQLEKMARGVNGK